jgi:hypothetical protein
MRNTKIIMIIFSLFLLKCKSSNSYIEYIDLCSLQVEVITKKKLKNINYVPEKLFTSIFIKNHIIIIPIGSKKEINSYLSIIKESPKGFVECEDLILFIEKKAPPLFNLKKLEFLENYDSNTIKLLKNERREFFNDKERLISPPAPPPRYDFEYFVFNIINGKIQYIEITNKEPKILKDWYSSI